MPGTAGGATYPPSGAALVRTDARPAAPVGVPPAGAVGIYEISDTGVGRVQPGLSPEPEPEAPEAPGAPDGQSAPPPAGGGGGSYASGSSSTTCSGNAVPTGGGGGSGGSSAARLPGGADSSTSGSGRASLDRCGLSSIAASLPTAGRADARPAWRANATSWHNRTPRFAGKRPQLPDVPVGVAAESLDGVLSRVAEGAAGGVVGSSSS
ncbi:hypothetical protein Asi02nite_37860 [Asanoa siamensis]|uniref:Uncharacterized protein n=1 Tax=Asanoa siamensis TaxID=926357 RepID=A0ABQ4CSM0_9ACTN|nr:hypothetical protein Asi02nite_37860 [Asanoa siamensis]